MRAFVGRRADLDAVDAAVAGGGTHRVLFVHGLGGIGKTTLLQQFRICAGRSIVELDARDIDCSPQSFTAAYQLAAGATDAPSTAGKADDLVLAFDEATPRESSARQG